MSGSLSLSTVAQSDDPPLLDGLGGRSDLRSDDFGLVELLRSLRTATWGWVEAEERGRAARRVAGKFHEAITGSRRVAPAQMHPNHPRRVWTAHGA
jgi:hypothetical protein